MGGADLPCRLGARRGAAYRDYVRLSFHAIAVRQEPALPFNVASLSRDQCVALAEGAHKLRVRL